METHRKGGKTIVLAATGASGARLAVRFLHLLLAHDSVSRVHFIPSDGFKLVALREDGLDAGAFLQGLPSDGTCPVHHEKELDAPVSSGSYPVDATVILPASMATVGAVASGAGRNLVHRAAEVALKEGRPLVVVPRETPLSLIHLRNLVRIKEAGATVAPFVPAFYQGPVSVEDLVDHFLMRLFDHLGLATTLSRRWS